MASCVPSRLAILGGIGDHAISSLVSQRKSESTTIWNGEIGYRFSQRARVSIEGFNLLDSDVSDIDYFYTSRLPGEPAAGYTSGDLFFQQPLLDGCIEALRTLLAELAPLDVMVSVELAKASPWPDPATVLENVYA